MPNTIIQVVLFGFLLVGSFYFGYIGKPTEMSLSILTGSIALAFANIDKISKFKGAGFEAEMRETREAVEAMVAKEAEPSVEPKIPTLSSDSSTLRGADAAVVRCLGNSKYAWRTINGIANESDLSPYTVRYVLRRLIDDGLAVRMGGEQVYWGLTERGREIFNSLPISSQ